MEENENAKRLSLSGTLKRPEPTSQSPFSLASWLMVITDDLEHSSKSLFPYDQYEIWKSIYAIAAITQNQRFNKFSVNAMIKYSSVVI